MSRAKFSGEVAIEKVTLYFEDGRSVYCEGDDARHLALITEGLGRPVSVIDLLKYAFAQHGKSPLHLVRNETLAKAVSYGSAEELLTLRFAVEGVVHVAEQHNTAAEIDATFTLRVNRVNDG